MSDDLAGFIDELNAEIEAFLRDLAKFSSRMDEIHQDASQYVGGLLLHQFRGRVAKAQEQVNSAWRILQWAGAAISDR